MSVNPLERTRKKEPLPGSFIFSSSFSRLVYPSWLFVTVVSPRNCCVPVAAGQSGLHRGQAPLSGCHLASQGLMSPGFPLRRSAQPIGLSAGENIPPGDNSSCLPLGYCFCLSVCLSHTHSRCVLLSFMIKATLSFQSYFTVVSARTADCETVVWREHHHFILLAKTIPELS